MRATQITLRNELTRFGAFLADVVSRSIRMCPNRARISYGLPVHWRNYGAHERSLDAKFNCTNGIKMSVTMKSCSLRA